MKILVLGGAGYIGSILRLHLEEKGDEVIVMDTFLYESHHSFSPPNGQNGSSIQKSQFIRGDIRSINDLLPQLSKVDAVVNLAAISNDPASDLKPELTWQINFQANDLLSQLCKSTKKRIVYASSCSVYGFSPDKTFSEESPLGPVTLYAHTKMLSEKFYLDPNVDAIILRFATVYGYSPKARLDLVVNTMIGTSYFQNKIVVNGGEQWRPVVHVKDVAQAIYCALHKKNPPHRIYNVGSNEQNYKITDLAKYISQELPHVQLINNSDTKDGRSYKVDFTRIKKELGFITTHTIKDAISEFYDAFKQNKITTMEDDEYYRVKYLKRYVYKDHPIKKFTKKINAIFLSIGIL